MKAFLKTLLHAVLGGFSAGIAAYTGGAGVKSLLAAGVASAITSALSLLAKSPVSDKPSTPSGRASSLGVSVLITLILVPTVFTTGCKQLSPTEAVSKAVKVFTDVQLYIADGQSLAASFRALEPQLAAEIDEYGKLAQDNVATLIKSGNAFLSAPSDAGYLNLVNQLNAMILAVDQKALEAAKITNPASQNKILTVIALISVALHSVSVLLVHSATDKQILPVKSAAFEQLKHFINRGEVRNQLMARGYAASEVMEAAGI